MPETKLEDEPNSSEEITHSSHINHRIIPVSERAEAILNQLVEVALINDECTRTLCGKRKRPKEMIERLRYCLTAYLSNLIVLSLTSGLQASLRVSRSNRIKVEYRYTPEPFTVNAAREAQNILTMPENGLTRLDLGERGRSGCVGIQSTLSPSEKLLEAVKNLNEMDFSLKAEHEVIVLKKKSVTETDHSKKPKGDRIEYEDSDYTNKAREQVESINQFLNQSDIKLSGKDLPLKDRQLKRYFNGSFIRGGRLFGGKWQGSKTERKHYTINGQKCVEVDFVACGVRLAYARAGVALAGCIKGDPYELVGQGMFYKRAGIKQIVSAMLCMGSPMSRFPRNTKTKVGAGKKENIDYLKGLLEKHFSPIAHLFYSGIGLELMHTESEILIEALLTLQSKGIVALPIHDCVVVAESDQAVAQEVMLEAFLKVSGQSGKVDVKSL